jgi:hypothetical protein
MILDFPSTRLYHEFHEWTNDTNKDFKIGIFIQSLTIGNLLFIFVCIYVRIFIRVIRKFVQHLP